MKYECASCRGHVDMENYSGQALECPHCHQAAHFLALPADGAVRSSSASRPGSGAVIGGWVCFGLAAVFALLPFPTFYIYGPLALVAFILGIVAIAQKRLGQGLGILLSSIIGLPIVVLIAWVLGLGLLATGFTARLKNQNYSAAVERAQKGDPEGMRELGWCYYRGWGVSSDKKLAREWFEKAAQRGDTESMRIFAGFNHFGIGGLTNQDVADTWLQKAASGGDTQAVAIVKSGEWPPPPARWN